MPTEAPSTPGVADTGAPWSEGQAELEKRSHDRRTLRLGIGVTVAFLIALLYGWTLAYLAPIFVAPMLQAPEGPSPGVAAKALVAIFAVGIASLYLASLSQIYPVFFLIALFPALFWTFRFGLSGGSALIMLVALCELMLVPMVANTTTEITRNVAKSFLQNIGLSFVIAMVMFALFPPGPMDAAQKPKPVLPPPEATRRAAVLTAITGSYAVLYFSFAWANVHTPLYIAVFAFSLNLARGSSAAKGILMANVAAGVLTMILYQLTRMTPYIPFVAAMMLAVNLVIARAIASKSPLAPLAGFGLSVLMILYGDSLLPFSDSGGSNFTYRFGELALAAIWAIGALYLIEAFFPTAKPAEKVAAQ